MDAHVVGHRPQQTEFVHLLSQLGQVFAKANAGSGGLYRLKFATNFGGGAGFHVPQIDVAGSAEEKNEDARLSRLWGIGRVRSGGGTELLQLQGIQTDEAQSADLQAVPPR